MVAFAPSFRPGRARFTTNSCPMVAWDGALSASTRSPADAADSAPVNCGTLGAAGFAATCGAGPPVPGAIASAPGAVAASRSGGAPGFASVPEENCAATVSGRAKLRTTRGVSSMMISVLLRWSVVLEKRRPVIGRSPRYGILFAARRSSSLMRPASTCVSPSRSRSVVAVLRVPSR